MFLTCSEKYSISTGWSLSASYRSGEATRGGGEGGERGGRGEKSKTKDTTDVAKIEKRTQRLEPGHPMANPPPSSMYYAMTESY